MLFMAFPLVAPSMYLGSDGGQGNFSGKYIPLDIMRGHGILWFRPMVRNATETESALLAIVVPCHHLVTINIAVTVR